MVLPARPERSKLRRTLSTSGSSGMAKPCDSSYVIFRTLPVIPAKAGIQSLCPACPIPYLLTGMTGNGLDAAHGEGDFLALDLGGL